MWMNDLREVIGERGGALGASVRSQTSHIRASGADGDCLPKSARGLQGLEPSQARSLCEIYAFSAEFSDA